MSLIEEDVEELAPVLTDHEADRRERTRPGSGDEVILGIDTDVHSGQSIPEPVIQRRVLLRQKLSDRLVQFMRVRGADHLTSSSYKTSHPSQSQSDGLNTPMTTYRHSDLPTVCPPPPKEICDGLYVPDYIEEIECKGIEAVCSMRLLNNRFLHRQLRLSFKLVEELTNEEENLENVISNPDLRIRTQDGSSEIGIVFVRLSKLIGGAVRREELEATLMNSRRHQIEMKPTTRRSEACLTTIARLSSCYPRLLIIFEAHPIKPTDLMSKEVIPYAYTPPTIANLKELKEAVKDLEEQLGKRGIDFFCDLSISESYQRSVQIARSWVEAILS